MTNLKEIPLPGYEAHALLVPPNRRAQLGNINFSEINPKKAAVLIHFYPDAEEEVNFVLIERNTYAGVHSGQISLPGGKPEPQDNDLWATALREAREEVGIFSSQVQFLRVLSKVFIPPSNFLVTPYLGYSMARPDFTPELSEVAHIIELPLSKLLENDVSTSDQAANFTTPIEVPSYVFDQKIVWGATAMILSELKMIILNAPPK